MEKVYDSVCFECRCCEQICTHNAISFIENAEGFSYPIINKDSCINCGLCSANCPANNAYNLKNNPQKVYAAQVKDKSVLSKSSSGGMFSLIASFIINNKGIVYGACFDENFKCKHIGVTSLDELDLLRGSKYVHSDVGLSYKQIKKKLREGELVYFTGTPCQVAGLKSYLKKDYENLITSDLICHGTPSQKSFDLIVNNIEKERDARLVKYLFRDKKILGWGCSSSSLVIERKGKLSYVYYDKNVRAYYNAFINGHLTRMDCYQCPFATPERVGDITIADYWDVRKHHPNFPNIQDGVSLILVNSSKGQRFFDGMKDNLVVLESTLEKAIDTSNRNLTSPTAFPKERKNVYERLFSDYISFRESYLAGDKAEFWFRKMFIKYKIKQSKLGRLLLKLIGKL